MERWQPIPGCDYEASTCGRIRRVTGGQGAIAGRVLAGMRTNNGYRTVQITKGGVRKTRHIHRLVAEAFHGPCPKGYHVNHKDGVKSNNRPDNLEYVSRSENMQHAYETGLNPLGSDRPNSKLTADDVRAIRRAPKYPRYQQDLARRFGIAQATVSAIISRKIWKSVPESRDLIGGAR